MEAQRRFRAERDVAIAGGCSHGAGAGTDGAADQRALTTAGQAADECTTCGSTADEAGRALALAFGLTGDLRSPDGIGLTVEVNAVELDGECGSAFESTGGMSFGDGADSSCARRNNLLAFHNNGGRERGVEALAFFANLGADWLHEPDVKNCAGGNNDGRWRGWWWSEGAFVATFAGGTPAGWAPETSQEPVAPYLLEQRKTTKRER